MLIADRSAMAKQGTRSHQTVAFYKKKCGMVLATLSEILGRKSSAPIFLREVNAGLVDRYVTQRRNDEVSESTIAHEITTWRAAMRIARRRGLWAEDVDAVFPDGLSRGKARSRWLTFDEVHALYLDAHRRPGVRTAAEWTPEQLDHFHAAASLGKNRFAISEHMTAIGAKNASPASIGRRLRALRGPLRPARGEPVEREHEPSTAAGLAFFAKVAFCVATSAEWSALGRARREDVALDFSHARVRGSKNTRRDRVVPLELLAFRLLLAFAVEHADGRDGRLFANLGSFRARLTEACARLGIPHASPTDLRRTHAKWLRLSGVAPANIAPSMGHASSKMVELVYGQASAEELAHVQSAEIARLPAVTVRLMSGEGAEASRFEAVPADPSGAKTDENQRKK
jgi:integrase